MKLFSKSCCRILQVADQQSSMFGQCCFEVGDVKCSMGTGTFVDVNTGSKPHASMAGTENSHFFLPHLKYNHKLKEQLSWPLPQVSPTIFPVILPSILTVPQILGSGFVLFPLVLGIKLLARPVIPLGVIDTK